MAIEQDTTRTTGVPVGFFGTEVLNESNDWGEAGVTGGGDIVEIRNHGQQGSSHVYALSQAMELSRAIALANKPKLYPGMCIDGAVLSFQLAEPPKPKTPKPTTALSSAPLSERRKLLKAKMAKRKAVTNGDA